MLLQFFVSADLPPVTRLWIKEESPKTLSAKYYIKTILKNLTMMRSHLFAYRECFSNLFMLAVRYLSVPGNSVDDSRITINSAHVMMVFNARS